MLLSQKLPIKFPYFTQTTRRNQSLAVAVSVLVVLPMVLQLADISRIFSAFLLLLLSSIGVANLQHSVSVVASFQHIETGTSHRLNCTNHNRKSENTLNQKFTLHFVWHTTRMMCIVAESTASHRDNSVDGLACKFGDSELCRAEPNHRPEFGEQMHNQAMLFLSPRRLSRCSTNGNCS